MRTECVLNEIPEMKAVLIDPEKRSIESVDINNLNGIVRLVAVVMPSSENNVNLAPLALGSDCGGREHHAAAGQ